MSSTKTKLMKVRGKDVERPFWWTEEHEKALQTAQSAANYTCVATGQPCRGQWVPGESHAMCAWTYRMGRGEAKAQRFQYKVRGEGGKEITVDGCLNPHGVLPPGAPCIYVDPNNVQKLNVEKMHTVPCELVTVFDPPRWRCLINPNLPCFSAVEVVTRAEKEAIEKGVDLKTAVSHYWIGELFFSVPAGMARKENMPGFSYTMGDLERIIPEGKSTMTHKEALDFLVSHLPQLRDFPPGAEQSFDQAELATLATYTDRTRQESWYRSLLLKELRLGRIAGGGDATTPGVPENRRLGVPGALDFIKRPARPTMGKFGPIPTWKSRVVHEWNMLHQDMVRARREKVVAQMHDLGEPWWLKEESGRKGVVSYDIQASNRPSYYILSYTAGVKPGLGLYPIARVRPSGIPKGIPQLGYAPGPYEGLRPKGYPKRYATVRAGEKEVITSTEAGPAHIERATATRGTSNIIEVDLTPALNRVTGFTIGKVGKNRWKRMLRTGKFPKFVEEAFQAYVSEWWMENKVQK